MIEFIQTNLAFCLFILFLTIFLIVKRKNLQVSGPFPLLYMLMYKTTWGLDKMNHWAHKHPKLFLNLAYLSAFVGIVGMFASFFFMIWQLDFMVDKQITAGGGLVLPIQTESGLNGTVPVFFVPFFYWIIALFILAVVHEFAHGVIAERFKVKIKSSGFAFLGILAPIMPAAFVEPDEKQLNKKPWWQKVAVLGAGSTSNFLFGFFFLFLWIFVSAPLIDNTMKLDNIKFNSVMNQSDLYGQIDSGTILSVNGIYDVEKTYEYFGNLSINQTVNLEILDSKTNETKNFSVTTFKHTQIPDKGMLGISGLNVPLVNKQGFEWLGKFPIEFERVLFWIWFLNISIGIMNLLPIWITDGGQVSKTMFSKWCGNMWGNRIYHTLSWMVLAILFLTLKPAYLYSLLGLF